MLFPALVGFITTKIQGNGGHAVVINGRWNDLFWRKYSSKKIDPKKEVPVPATGKKGGEAVNPKQIPDPIQVVYPIKIKPEKNDETTEKCDEK